MVVLPDPSKAATRIQAAFRSYRVRKNLQQVRHAFEEIATQLDSGSVTVTWTKSNLPCNPSFYAKKDTKTRQLSPVNTIQEDIDSSDTLSRSENHSNDDSPDTDTIEKGINEWSNIVTTSDGSSLDTSQDNIDQAISPIPLENLKQSSAIPQADNMINHEILNKDSLLNDTSSEDDVKFESTSLSETNADERKEKMDQTSDSSGSKEYHEPRSEIDNALPYCATDGNSDQNDVIDSDSKEKTIETKNQNVSDDHEYDHAIPGDIAEIHQTSGQAENQNVTNHQYDDQSSQDPLPQKMDDDKQFKSIQDNNVSSNNSDNHTNLIDDDNNRDLEVNDSKSNSNCHYVTPTGTLLPTQRNKIDNAMVNDSWDMIDNMPHIKERVNIGKSNDPKDMDSLLKLRSELATELLWIEQAIISRKNCLKVKAQYRNGNRFTSK